MYCRGVARPPFPTTLRQFQLEFAGEEACQDYLAACRWPDGFACARCGHRRAYAIVKRRRWQCAACRFHVSLTFRTIPHNTKIPLTSWFWAAYFRNEHSARRSLANMTGQPVGTAFAIEGVELARQLRSKALEFRDSLDRESFHSESLAKVFQGILVHLSSSLRNLHDCKCDLVWLQAK